MMDTVAQAPVEKNVFPLRVEKVEHGYICSVELSYPQFMSAPKRYAFNTLEEVFAWIREQYGENKEAVQGFRLEFFDGKYRARCACGYIFSENTKGDIGSAYQKHASESISIRHFLL